MQYVTSFERLAREEGFREGVLTNLEVSLEIKFGAEGLKLLPDIQKIEDVEILQKLLQALKTAVSPDELRRIYSEKENGHTEERTS